MNTLNAVTPMRKKLLQSAGSLALVLACGALAAFSAAPAPVLAAPPGMHHPGGPGPGPGFGPGPRPHPGFRPAPPPPPPRHHRDWHRPWYKSWGFWAPAITLGAIAGVELYQTQPTRVVPVPVQPVPAAPPAPVPSARGGSHAWYWAVERPAHPG